MQAKTPEQSKTIMTDMVLPGETNPLNNLFGGELLARMDRAASIAARRHSRRIAVTASVNHVAFNRAIPLGSVVTIEAKINLVGQGRIAQQYRQRETRQVFHARKLRKQQPAYDTGNSPEQLAHPVNE